ncbi:MAG: hypothetical protein ACU843_10955 [Gammaproteobacteria bacterium]
MAIKEFWIQIENHYNPARAKNQDCVRRQDPTDAQGLRPADGANAVGDANRLDSAGLLRSGGSGNGDYIPTRSDELLLRRYKPPGKKNKRDAWTVPAEALAGSAALEGFTSGNRSLSSQIPCFMIDCKPGDRVIVHFRNNDQRKRIVTKMLEISLPYGGTMKLPTPFSEPIPTEVRTHCFHPRGIDYSPYHDREAVLSLPGPKQAVGSEAPVWREVGVTTYKKGDRVPPGGTFTYIWDTP